MLWYNITRLENIAPSDDELVVILSVRFDIGYFSQVNKYRKAKLGKELSIFYLKKGAILIYK